jgi:hypothetical protein
MNDSEKLNQAVASFRANIAIFNAIVLGAAAFGYMAPAVLRRRVEQLDILYWEAVEWRIRCDRECMFHAEVAMDDEATPVPLAALYRHAWALAWERALAGANLGPSSALWSYLDRRGLIQ